MKTQRFSESEFQEMKKRARSGVKGKIGLGDRVHNVLGKVGLAIHWPCMKGDGTTDLKPKSLCDYFRITLNKI